MSIFSSLFSYFTKSANLPTLVSAPTNSSNSVEKIDVEFAKLTREAVRYLSANNTDVSSVITAKVAGIIGRRINIQSRLEDDILNSEIESYIKEWSEVGNCDVTGRFHFDGMLRSMVSSLVKEGGLLVRHHYNNSWEIPYRVENISLSMIDTKVNTIYGEKVLNGLRKNKYGRVTGIYIYDDINKMKSTLVPMKNLTFFSQVWIDLTQYTAVSKLASILPSIDLLDQFTDAQLKGAISSAKSGMYWKTAMYDDILKLVSNIKDNTKQKSELNKIMRSIGEQGIKPDGLTPVPLGDELVQGKNESDNVFNDLTSSTQTKIGAGVGQAGIITYQDASKANYSSMKATLALSEVNWSIDFDDIEAHIIRPILKRILDVGVTSQSININNYFITPRKFFKFVIMRVTSIDIEPLKTAKADATRLENKTHSLREIVAQRGRDLQDVQREQIQDEINYIKLREDMFKSQNIKELKNEN